MALLLVIASALPEPRQIDPVTRVAQAVDNIGDDHDSRRLRSLLIPPGQLPEGTQLFEPVSLAEYFTPGFPPGMTSDPASCLTFVTDGLGDISGYQGWVQAGRRGTFITFQMIAHIPGGFDVDRFRQAVATCATGTLTLENRLSANVTFTEIAPPDYEAATAFITRMVASFPEARNADDVELMARYNFHQQHCPADYIFIATGDLLIWSLDPDPVLAEKAARIMHERALQSTH